MTVRTPAPLAAAVGLAVEAAGQLRRLPTLLVELPPAVVHQVDSARQVALERYAELARHGRDVLAGRHLVTPAADHTVPVADRDVLVAEHDAPDSVGAPGAADRPVAEPATPPPAPVPPLGRTEPVEIPVDVLEDVAQLTPGDELAHEDLPLADFDHQTVPHLRGRLRTLALPELIQLRDYEQAHGRRLPVLTLLDNRIAKLAETVPDGTQ
jgi:hypothetical protein